MDVSLFYWNDIRAPSSATNHSKLLFNTVLSTPTYNYRDSLCSPLPSAPERSLHSVMCLWAALV